MKMLALVGVVVLAVLLVIQDRGGSDAVEGLMSGIGFVILVPVSGDRARRLGPPAIAQVLTRTHS